MKNNFRISRKTHLLFRQALREDLGRGDVTTDTLIPRGQMATAAITAKQKGILAGALVVREVFQSVDPRLQLKRSRRDGSKVNVGDKVFEVRGCLRSILKGERVALNFLGHLSGIATLTHQFSQKVKGTKAKIFDTRKTTPLWRELEKQAVLAGGGQNHRFGLSDQALVKDNHWAFFQLGPSLRAKRSNLRIGERHALLGLEMTMGIRKLRRKIFTEIEVRNLRELICVLPMRPHAILLDHFDAWHQSIFSGGPLQQRRDGKQSQR